MLEYNFMQNAFMAGTVIAMTCGIVSYFIIMRRMAFAAHASSYYFASYSYFWLQIPLFLHSSKERLAC